MSGKGKPRLLGWITAGMLSLCLGSSIMAPVANAQQVEPSPEMKAFLEAPPQPKASAGAHRQNDPHVNLSPQKMAQVALQHFDESRPQLAFETLNAAIVKYPENAMLLSLRASLFLQTQQTSKALADLNRAVELNPHDPAILTNRAQALRQFDRNDDARRDLDQAIKLDPGVFAAHFNRGSLYYEAAKFDLALEDFNRCIELEPEVPAGYFNRASTYDALGERELAISNLQHFLTLQPEASWSQIAEDMLKQWQAELS